MTNKIITISREYGSGGRTVGELVAKELGVPFYDKEMVNAMAEACGFSHDFIEEIGEYASVTNSFLFSIAISSRMEGTVNMMSAADQLYACQANYIRELAEKGPCVIVGRCADYVLRDDPKCVSFFVKADMDSRIERAVKYYGMEEKNAEDALRKADKRRASYYNYYATSTWGDVNNYDLCVDTGAVGVEGAVELMAQFVEMREKFKGYAK